jgi:hypothetical protein
MKKVETPDSVAIFDGVRVEPEREQLIASDHAMLPSRQPSQKNLGWRGLG